MDAVKPAELHIVLADDNRELREYMARLLRTRWSVEAVGDGEAALAAIRRRRPALILTNTVLRGLDGFGLLRAVRSDPATRSIPVVMLTGRASDDSRIESATEGADDFVVKPFSSRELLTRVAARLARRGGP